MYNNYEEEEDDWDLPEDKDPFQEDVNTEVNIGTVQVRTLFPSFNGSFDSLKQTYWQLG